MNNTTVYFVDNFPKTNPFRMPALSELLDIFPEAVPSARKQLKELKETHTIYSKKYKAKLKLKINEIYLSDIEDKDFAVWFWDFFIYELPLEKLRERKKLLDCKYKNGILTQRFYIYKTYDKIKLLENILKTYEWKKRPKNSGDITDVEIAHAKEYPIKNILSEPINQAGFSLCVFHKDTNPSLKIYKEENRYHCFSCSASGDVIDLVQHIHNLKFIDAVKRLI